MKIITLTAVLAAFIVAGCASTAGRDTPAAVPAPAAVQPSMKIPPAASRKLVLNLSGPPSSTDSKDWPDFKEEWRATFADHAKEAGVAFELQQGEPRATGETGTLLKVFVTDYRKVGIGSRIFFGVMTGNAYIDARAVFADLASGASFGERAFNTSSSAWAGVFGKMTPQQVDAIATQVFEELKKP